MAPIPPTKIGQLPQNNRAQALRLSGEVKWDRLREKNLDRWLKANARARHFNEAVSNILSNDEGELVKAKPLTWRR